MRSRRRSPKSDLSMRVSFVGIARAHCALVRRLGQRRAVKFQSVSCSVLSSKRVVLSVTLVGCEISAVCGFAIQPTVGFAAGGSADNRGVGGAVITGGAYET